MGVYYNDFDMSRVIVFLCVVITFFSLLVYFSPLKKLGTSIYTWYTLQTTFSNGADELSLDEIGVREVLSQYYIAQNYKFINTEKAIHIAERVLSQKKRITKKEKLLLWNLLGELYFYVQDYAKSAQYYWQVLLIDEKNDKVRYDYENAMRLYKNTTDEAQIEELSAISARNLQQTLELESDNSEAERIPLPLNKIITNKEYFFFVQEKSTKTNNQW